MIVYGDPQFTCHGKEATRLLRAAVDQMRANDHDSIRKGLIHLGQLEQALADLPKEHTEEREHALTALQTMTDRAADVFYKSFRQHELNGAPLAELRSLAWRLELPDENLTIKVPEGFEFYSLYPEQYIYAAFKWMEAHASERWTDVVVVGLRSIGTTLSAVVSATLQMNGWRPKRQTTRPTGHPFARRLSGLRQSSAKYALVVDEGPGMSGSSMAAAAEALQFMGIPSANISFLPGSDKSPGPAADEGVRTRWASTRRFFVPLSSLRWQGCSLCEILLSSAQELSGKEMTLHDISAGNWRSVAFPSSSQYPPSFIPFERTKYLCQAADGSAVLWKYSGLGALRGCATQLSIRDTLNPPVLTTKLGFAATPWIEGKRLKRGDASATTLPLFAKHLLQKAGDPLSPGEHLSAIDRLAEMTYWNVRNTLGETAAVRAVHLVDAVRSLVGTPSYGDGRVAPWEWIRQEDGSLVKTDNSGHDSDHTMIGRQSILWDVAGLLVEWELSLSQQDFLLKLFAEGGIDVQSDALAFYVNAYCAFQIGKAALSQSIVTEEIEKDRLAAAQRFYCSRLFTSVEDFRCCT